MSHQSPFHLLLKKTVLLLALLRCLPLPAQSLEPEARMPPEDYNLVLGTNSFYASYQHTKDTKIMEQANQTRNMGSNILKFAVSTKALKDYGIDDSAIEDIMDVVSLMPDYQKSFDMDFTYYFMWLHTATGIKWKKGINTTQEKLLYEEMYDFASHLLSTYDNTGKVFFIGNWEGDWLLLRKGKNTPPPTEAEIQNMIRWFQIRQRAIDDAKKATKHKNVAIYHYIEVNLALRGLENKPCVTKDVLPFVNVDFVSYSSYETTKRKTYQANKDALQKAVTYIEQQMQPKQGLPFSRRVFIGEYGEHATKSRPDSFRRQFANTKEIMQIALELDLPFALYWNMYNNEYTDEGDSKNMSLINEQGQKRPAYHLHQRHYRDLNNYLREYHQQNHAYPSHKRFKTKALSVLETIYAELLAEYFPK